MIETYIIRFRTKSGVITTYAHEANDALEATEWFYGELATPGDSLISVTPAGMTPLNWDVQ